MQITLTPQAEHAIHSLMSDGATADEVVERALRHELRRQEDFAAIQEGLADIEAGRTYSIEEVDREIRERHGFAPAK